MTSVTKDFQNTVKNDVDDQKLFQNTVKNDVDDQRLPKYSE